MARHTHIVSLGLFHKTFHSSLLQETFCFLMYDVLLSIYKINLIKKNKSCGICLATFIQQSPLRRITVPKWNPIHDDQHFRSVESFRVRRTLRISRGFAFLTYADRLFVPRERRIYISQGRYDPLIKDEREQQSSSLIHLADSKTGATCRGSLLDLAPFGVMSRTISHNYTGSFG